MQKDTTSGGPVRAASYDEIQEMLQQQRKHQEILDENYRGLKCPIHLVTDPDHNILGGFIWSILNGRTPYGGRFGISKNIHVDPKKPLLLDYTSCLMLCKLNLFDKICSLFKTIWLESHIFEIWLSDIHGLKNVQTSIVQKDIRLSDMLTELSFVDCPHKETMSDYSAYDPIDYIALCCAKNENALIVDKTPTGEISGKPVPEEWYELNIQPADFYAVLDSLNLPHPDYDKQKVNPSTIERIKPHCNLVLDEQVLAELLESGSIRDVFSLFNIVLPSEKVHIIHENADTHRHRAAAAKWLEDSYNYVSCLKANGKLMLKPAMSVGEAEYNPYMQLLCNEFRIASEASTTFVVDDRFCSSYYHVGTGKRASVIITTYDLIESLYMDQTVDTSTYYNLIDGMLAAGYSYFVPPVDYLFSRLSLASINSENVLEEHEHLKHIRKSVAFAFSEEFGLKTNQVGGSNTPELTGYFLELNSAFRDCLSAVWKSDKPYEWRKAASDWLLAFLGDYMCDIDGVNRDSEDMFAWKQSTLLVIAFNLQDNQQKRIEYNRWLEPYMVASWSTNPKLIELVAERTLEVIDAFDFKEAHLTDVMIELVEQLIYRFVAELPYLLRNEMLRKPRFARYRKYVRGNDTQVVSNFQDISICMDEAPTLEKEKILAGDLDAFESAIIFILANIRDNPDIFLDEFPVECLYGVRQSSNYDLARFMADIAWYFPPSKVKCLHKLKRKLSMLLKNNM